MKDKKLDEKIRQAKNKYFRDYYKNNKEAVLKTQRKYWERKLKQEQENNDQQYTYIFKKGAMFQYMNISEKQIEQLSKYISVIDVKSYIETHLLEYEQFLEDERKKN